MDCETGNYQHCLFFKRDSVKRLNFFQAEDLVANFFPKKLLELDNFLKVSYTFIQLNVFCLVIHPFTCQFEVCDK